MNIVHPMDIEQATHVLHNNPSDIRAIDVVIACIRSDRLQYDMRFPEGDPYYTNYHQELIMEFRTKTCALARGNGRLCGDM